MQAVDEHGQPVDERGQPLHNANSNNHGNVAPLPCVPLKAFFLPNTTLEEYLALANADKVQPPTLIKEQCRLCLEQDLDGVVLSSQSVMLKLAVQSRGHCLAQGLDDNSNWVHGYEASFATMPSFTRSKVLYGPSSSSRLVEIGFATVLGKQMCLELHLCPKQEGREEAVKALQQLVQGPHYGEAIQGKMREVLGFVCWSPSNTPKIGHFCDFAPSKYPLLAMDGGRNFRPPLCMIESLFSHLPTKPPRLAIFANLLHQNTPCWQWREVGTSDLPLLRFMHF